MEEILILSMALCVGLAVIGYALKAWPVTFISSIGWVVLACEVYSQYESFLALGLMIMLAISQVILVRDIN
jgi:hypothetical protein